MEIFERYKPKANFIELEPVESKIIKELFKINHSFHNKKLMTKNVKLSLVHLGHKLGYKVYARVYTEELWNDERNAVKFSKELGIDKSRYKNKEWLYDVHWYTDVLNPNNDNALHYIPKTFELACECEWSKNLAKSWNQNKKDIGYDFQKLLFSNAKFNLFICRCYTDREILDLFSYFKNAIKEFYNLHSGANFLIVCFRAGELYYAKFKK